jgi:RluA family pseudouridine synthase
MKAGAPESWVLFQDDELLIINKPAGLPTLPDGYDAAADHVRSLLEPVFGPLWIVHRLDRHTSGVLVLARSAAAHRALNTQFAERTVAKRYHAIVVGQPTWESYEAHWPLRADGDRRHRTVVDARQGKAAHTSLTRLETFARDGARWALVAAQPHTGRTHQVRAHLAAAGLPILADTLYGGGESLTSLPTRRSRQEEEPRLLLARPALHAATILISHPTSGEPLAVDAPYPSDFAAALRYLRRGR